MNENTQLEFHRDYGPVPPADVAAFESRIGVALPEELRIYLLTHGGGSRPRRDWLPVEPNDFYRAYNHDGWVRVQQFERFAVGPKNTVRAELNAIYAPDASPEAITHVPVVSDSGNLFFIGVRGASRGTVWWGTREAFWEAGLTEGNTLCPVAASFNGFLSSLQTEEELPQESRAALLG